MSVATRTRLYVPWLILACACAALMWFVPGEETIPYHVGFIGLALAYGVEPWPWLRTLVSVLAYAVMTGGILVTRAVQGIIGYGETAEIPLMATLVLIAVHNVRIARRAHARLARIAWRDRLRAERRERISRMTSHEMRTPATIAIGYVEMLIARERDRQQRDDLEVVRDELTRLALVGSRLVRTIQLHDEERMRRQDVRALVQETAERWSVVAERNWKVSCPPISYVCSAERFRACLDTLVENALRYTESGDTIRILARTERDHLLVGVADSGPGMTTELLEAIARGARAGDTGDYTASDPRAQTGFGLALVQDSAELRGGRLVAGQSSEGGALVLMAVPATDAARDLTGQRAPGVRRSLVPPDRGLVR